MSPIEPEVFFRAVEGGAFDDLLRPAAFDRRGVVPWRAPEEKFESRARKLFGTARFPRVFYSYAYDRCRELWREGR